MSMPTGAENVILLHGLARTEKSMTPLQRALEHQGYRVVNVGYDSRHGSVETLAVEAIAPALAVCPADQPVHFVTHSLGGILVRQYLAHHEIANLGRVVMLGPPNKGSEVIDRLREAPGFQFINGDAGLELGTGAASVPNKLGGANFDLGIIAGTRSVNLILSTMIPGADDGKVSVENTRLEGMRDHLEMGVTHTFMMRNDAVIAQVIHYLENGHFKRTD
jgi:pimeloyl-ACP methyl ester carboxylesterase